MSGWEAMEPVALELRRNVPKYREWSSNKMTMTNAERNQWIIRYSLDVAYNKYYLSFLK